MSGERGVVLINALVVVLAIASVAAALLTRSEQSRQRMGDSRASAQLGLYLDSGEMLVAPLLREIADGGAVHPGQGWARADLVFPVDRGQIALRMSDLQGRVNINWLSRENAQARAIVADVFAELGLPATLLDEIAGFLSPAGPVSVAGYMARTPPVLPRGGPVGAIVDLRAVQGMGEAEFALLSAHFSALPGDTRLNLNTAPDIVASAALAAFPPEIAREVMDRTAPLASLTELRARTMELLETEDVDHLPFDLLTVGSTWFQADLTAELDGATQKRRAIFEIDPTRAPKVARVMRWSIYD